MTVAEILERCQEVKPSQYDLATLLQWLNQLERRIRTEIIDRHEDGPQGAFESYTENSMDVEPLAAGSFEDLYLYWLYAMIDYHNGEFGRYENHSALFNEAYDAYHKAYHRDHLPKPGKTINNVRGW